MSGDKSSANFRTGQPGLYPGSPGPDAWQHRINLMKFLSGVNFFLTLLSYPVFTKAGNPNPGKILIVT